MGQPWYRKQRRSGLWPAFEWLMGADVVFRGVRVETGIHQMTRAQRLSVVQHDGGLFVNCVCGRDEGARIEHFGFDGTTVECLACGRDYREDKSDGR